MADTTYDIDGDDPNMALAVDEARRTFRLFWRELSWEYRRIIPAFDMAMVKAGFLTDSNDPGAYEVEHMWIMGLEFDGYTIKGTLVNRPNWISTLNEGDQVEVSFSSLEDWILTCDGVVYGAFTVHAMRKAMSSNERASHDAAWGLDFGNPEEPRIVPERVEKKNGLLARVFGSKTATTQVDMDSPPEHPMSENMADRIRERVRENRDLAFSPDADGWTMLHREALAGNLTPVSILLEAGADVSAQTHLGDTALSLAKLMGWPRIVQALESASATRVLSDHQPATLAAVPRFSSPGRYTG